MLKSSIYEVISYLSHITFVRVVLFLRALSFKLQLTHKTLHSLMIYFVSSIYQLPMYPPYTIPSFMVFKDTFDLLR